MAGVEFAPLGLQFAGICQPEEHSRKESRGSAPQAAIQGRLGIVLQEGKRKCRKSSRPR